MINFEYMKEYLTIRATEHLYSCCKDNYKEIYEVWKSKIEESTSLFCDEINVKVKLMTDMIDDSIIRAYWIFDTEIPFGFCWAQDMSIIKQMRELKTFK